MTRLHLKYPGVKNGLSRLEYISTTPLIFTENPVNDTQLKQEVNRLKQLILDNIRLAPKEVTNVIIHQSDKVPLGSDYKLAESQAINKAFKDEPFYRQVCNILESDKDILAIRVTDERFKYAKFDVSENILRQDSESGYQYFSQVEVTLDWSEPKLRCAIL